MWKKNASFKKKNYLSIDKLTFQGSNWRLWNTSCKYFADKLGASHNIKIKIMYVNKYDTKDCKVRDDRRDGADKSDAKSGNY